MTLFLLGVFVGSLVSVFVVGVCRMASDRPSNHERDLTNVHVLVANDP